LERSLKISVLHFISYSGKFFSCTCLTMNEQPTSRLSLTSSLIRVSTCASSFSLSLLLLNYSFRQFMREMRRGSLQVTSARLLERWWDMFTALSF